MIPAAAGAFFGQAVVPALGRTILHSAWQVGLVIGVTGLALAALRRATANLRYFVACAGLVVALALPVATFVTLARATAGDAGFVPAAAATNSSPVPRRIVPTARAAPAVPVATPTEDSRNFRLEAAFPWLVSAWACGVLLLSLRLLGGWGAFVRLANRRAAAPRDQWRDLFERLVERM